MSPEEAAKAAVAALDAAIPGAPLPPALVQAAAQIVLAAVAGLKGVAESHAAAVGQAGADAIKTDADAAGRLGR